MNVVETLESRYLALLHAMAARLRERHPTFEVQAGAGPVGSLTEYQGHDLYVEAMRPLSNRPEPNCVALIFGVRSIPTSPLLNELGVVWGGDGIDPRGGFNVLEGEIPFGPEALRMIDEALPRLERELDDCLCKWESAYPSAPTQLVRVEAADAALQPGWRLLEWLSQVADEFSLRLLYVGTDEGRDRCDELKGMLAPFHVGERTRARVTMDGFSGERVVEVWRLNRQSIDALRAVMPQGVMGLMHLEPAWAEDLCVYRRGELIFGTITHEQVAFLRLPVDQIDGLLLTSGRHDDGAPR